MVMLPARLRGQGRRTLDRSITLLSIVALMLAAAVSDAGVVMATEPALRTPARDDLAAAPTESALGDGADVDSDEQPDIIVVMVDDLGYLGDQRVLERLPAIREMWLEGGMRFNQMHAETPLCGPARAALLTGRTGLANGVVSNDSERFDDTATIPIALDDAGYHTILAGKYLNDYEGTPTPDGWDQVFMRKTSAPTTYWLNDKKKRYPDRHFDGVLRKQAVRWMRRAPDDAPVFALITPRAPHRHPQQCTDPATDPEGCEYLPLPMGSDQGAEACEDIRPFKPADYRLGDMQGAVPWTMPNWPDGWPLVETCESLLVIDRMVAQLQTAQSKRGRDAVWIFLSDHGMSWGRKAWPLKHVPPASRIPFYVAGTGIEAATEFDGLLSNLDIAPTLASLGGAVLPLADGIDFSAALHGDPEFEGREEMHEFMVADPAGTYAGWKALRTPDWRWIRWDDGETQLYDESVRQGLQRDVGASHRKRVEAMDERLEKILPGGPTSSWNLRKLQRRASR